MTISLAKIPSLQSKSSVDITSIYQINLGNTAEILLNIYRVNSGKTSGDFIQFIDR